MVNDGGGGVQLPLGPVGQWHGQVGVEVDNVVLQVFVFFGLLNNAEAHITTPVLSPQGKQTRPGVIVTTVTSPPCS